MSIRLPFIDRIMVLSQALITGKRSALSRQDGYDVVVLPSPMRRGSQQSPLSSVHMLDPGPAIAAPPISSHRDRLRLVRTERGRYIDYTHSNMG